MERGVFLRVGSWFANTMNFNYGNVEQRGESVYPNKLIVFFENENRKHKTKLNKIGN